MRSTEIMLAKNEYSERAVSTLQRLAAANQQLSHGPGVSPEHFVPLCKYHNRAVARKLTRLLKDSDVHPEVRTTRMHTSLSVSIASYSTASAILKQFEETDPDTRAKSFSRDYDAVILISLVTFFAAMVSCFVTRFEGAAPVAVLVNGISLAFVAERWHRNYRYQIGKHFTLAEIMTLTAIVAINIAIWRILF